MDTLKYKKYPIMTYSLNPFVNRINNVKGVFNCLILASIAIMLTGIEPILKKMCSPASLILASIITILVSMEGIGKRISVNIYFRRQSLQN